MDSLSNFFNTNANAFNAYLSIKLSIAIVILLFTYSFVSGKIHEDHIFYLPIVLTALSFFIYLSSVGTMRHVFGWIVVIMCVVSVLSLIVANVLEGYGRAFIN